MTAADIERWAARIGSAMLASAMGAALAAWMFFWWSGA